MSNTKTTHPKGLYALFFTEMWERFSYYGMRALLVLYLTSQVMTGGFGLERANALEIYAIFTGLVYLTPIAGGLLADKILGQRKSIYIGGILMALGNFVLAMSHGSATQEPSFALLNLGLGLIIVGNGFFKPNISTMVGGLYEENDTRRDSGFTLFYMGINLGAFIAPLVSGTLGETVGWAWGFGSAGIGMLLGVLVFHLTTQHLGTVGMPPTMKDKSVTKFRSKDWLDIVGIIVGCAIATWALITFFTSLGDDTYSMIMNTLFIVGGIAVLYIVFKNTDGGNQWSRVGVIVVLCFFNIFFWAGFEQAGGTFNLFAEEKTNRMLAGFEIPTSWFQSINALGIFILAPVFAALWIALNRVNKNPNIPVKFGLGLVLLGLGFVVMYFANKASNGGVLISPLWLVFVYLLHTIGELFLSPIGLSMITKLSPPKIVSLMMGLWFSSIALANYMAGILENLLHKFDMELFSFLIMSSVASGIVLLAISPILKKMMKGVS